MGTCQAEPRSTSPWYGGPSPDARPDPLACWLGARLLELLPVPILGQCYTHALRTLGGRSPYHHIAPRRLSVLVPGTGNFSQLFGNLRATEGVGPGIDIWSSSFSFFEQQLPSHRNDFYLYKLLRHLHSAPNDGHRRPSADHSK